MLYAAVPDHKAPMAQVAGLGLELSALFQEFDEATQLLVDLTKMVRRKFIRIGRALFRALRLFVPDQRHEISLKKRLVLSANGVGRHVVLMVVPGRDAG